jgi:hypothetical protein
LPRNLRCPKCTTTFTVPDGQKPVCSKCGYGGTAGAKTGTTATTTTTTNAGRTGATFNTTGTTTTQASMPAKVLLGVCAAFMLTVQFLPWVRFTIFGNLGASFTPWAAGPDFMGTGNGSNFYFRHFGDLWMNSIGAIFAGIAVVMCVMAAINILQHRLKAASMLSFYGALAAVISVCLFFSGLVSKPNNLQFSELMKNLNVGVYLVLAAIVTGFVGSMLARKPAGSALRTN